MCSRNRDLDLQEEIRSVHKYLLISKSTHWNRTGDVVIYIQRPKCNVDCVAFLAGVLVLFNHTPLPLQALN